jgi:arginine repressor
MFSQILDQKTYLAVLNAAPDVPGEYDHLAWQIVDYLLDARNHNIENSSYLKVPLKAIAANFDITPNLVGRLIGELGLMKVRRNDGYYVYFTMKQLSILQDALAKKLVHS